MKFSAAVKAFMSLPMYSDDDQITILGHVVKEPLMRRVAVDAAFELACRFRVAARNDLLDQLCETVGLRMRRSIYRQETTHVFQRSYKLIGERLLADYRRYIAVPHRLPESLTSPFEDQHYQGLSVRRVLNVVTGVLRQHECVQLLLDELTEARDTCLTGFLTRVINAALSVVDYAVESDDYEREKLGHLLTAHLMSSGVTDREDILRAAGRYATARVDVDPDLMLTVLEKFTGLEWGYVDAAYLCFY